MTSSRARLPAAFVLILCCVGSAPSAAFAQAGTITKDMQTYCVNDYKKFCGDYGLQSSGFQSVHAQGGARPVAGLRASAGQSWKSFPSRGG